MQVIRVIPLVALPPNVPQVLDYFWANPLRRGALVQMSLGKRKVQGIVIDSLDIARQKLAVKKAGFALRQLDAVLIEVPQATEDQIVLAKWLAEQYAAAPATALRTVLPPFLGKRGHRLEDSGRRSLGNVASGVRIVRTDPQSAKEEINKLFTKNQEQTLLIVPEASLTHVFQELLTEQQPTIFHSGLGVPAWSKIYRGVAQGTTRHIIGTRGALFLPWKNLSQIIVEDPQHEAYKSDMSPRYNAPDVARQLAAIHGAALTFLTPALSATHRYLIDRKALDFQDKKPYWPQIRITSIPQERGTGNFSLFTRETQEALWEAYEDRKPILLYSGRRAYTTTAACTRCHTPVACPVCDIPLRFWKKGNDEMLICYRCGTYQNIPPRCLACKKGIIRSSGLAGSQKIAEAFNTMLDRAGQSKIDIPILDSDLIRSAKDEERFLKQLREMKAPVAVATQMIFSHRHSLTFDTIVIPQADALISNPDFRTPERLVLQMEKLADFHPQAVHIQTQEDHALFRSIPERDWDSVFAEELKERKALKWPPYVRLVKFTYSHRDKVTASRQANIGADRLMRAAEHNKWSKAITLLGPNPALVEHERGKWIQHIIGKTTLNGIDIGRLASYLPAGWTVDVDPRSIA
jgi:primosomal protein N' (replication factor Y) (superfamily II helicase)